MEMLRGECEIARSFARGISGHRVSSFTVAFDRGDASRYLCRHGCQNRLVEVSNVTAIGAAHLHHLTSCQREPRGLTPCSPANATCAWQGRRLASRRDIHHNPTVPIRPAWRGSPAMLAGICPLHPRALTRPREACRGHASGINGKGLEQWQGHRRRRRPTRSQ